MEGVSFSLLTDKLIADRNPAPLRLRVAGTLSRVRLAIWGIFKGFVD